MIEIEDDEDDFSDLDFEDEPEADPDNEVIDIGAEYDRLELDQYTGVFTEEVVAPLPKPASKPKAAKAPKPEPARRERKEPRADMMSGFCRFPETADPAASHARCKGWNDAVPDKAIAVCPCACHLEEPDLECGSCGGVLRLSTHLTNRDGEDTYVHVGADGEWAGEYCA